MFTQFAILDASGVPVGVRKYVFSLHPIANPRPASLPCSGHQAAPHAQFFFNHLWNILISRKDEFARHTCLSHLSPISIDLYHRVRAYMINDLQIVLNYYSCVSFRSRSLLSITVIPILMHQMTSIRMRYRHVIL